MQEFAQRRIRDSDELLRELIVECTSVQRMIEDIRTKVAMHLNTPENVDGCLLGSVDDYLVGYEDQVERLRA